MPSLKGVAGSLRETLKTFAYFDRTNEITTLINRYNEFPSDALATLIERMKASPVRSYNKVRLMTTEKGKPLHIEVRPYGGTEDLDANRYANWVGYNELTERLRLAGYIALNQQDGRIVVHGRELFPIIRGQ